MALASLAQLGQAGPGAAGPVWQREVVLALTAAPLYTLPALKVASDRFLGLPPGSGEGGSGGGASRRLSAFRIVPGPQIGLRISATLPLSPSLRLRGSAAYLLGQTEVRFPKGIDVFTDPARARLLGQNLRGDMAVEWGQDWRVSLGAGYDLALVHSHISSALIDVSAISRSAQTYGMLGFGHDLGPATRAELVLRFNAKDADLAVGILSRF